jgi:hypothetical protein
VAYFTGYASTGLDSNPIPSVYEAGVLTATLGFKILSGRAELKGAEPCYSLVT